MSVQFWLHGAGLFAFAMGFTACSSLEVDVPAPEVRVPEVMGETWAGGAGIGLQPAGNVNVTSNAGARPPDFSKPTTKSSMEVPIFADLGIGRHVQTSLALGPASHGALFSVMVQLTGDPAISVKEGSVPVAIYGRAGQAKGRANGTQAQLFGPGGFSWSGSLSSRINGLGASTGYRFTEKFLLYGGYATDWYRASGHVTQDPSIDGSSAGGTYDFHQHGSAQTVALGVAWGRTSVFSAQILNHRFKWSGAPTISQANYALSYRFAW